MATKHDANPRLICEIYRDKVKALFRHRPNKFHEAMKKSPGSSLSELVRPPEVKH